MRQKDREKESKRQRKRARERKRDMMKVYRDERALKVEPGYLGIS